jgi:hypothetical protein
VSSRVTCSRKEACTANNIPNLQPLFSSSLSVSAACKSAGAVTAIALSDPPVPHVNSACGTLGVFKFR